jgi:hypothetical protein
VELSLSTPQLSMHVLELALEGFNGHLGLVTLLRGSFGIAQRLNQRW